MSCVGKKCTECADHMIKLGKVVCNKNNRLGLRGSKVSDFLGGDEEKDG